MRYKKQPLDNSTYRLLPFIIFLYLQSCVDTISPVAYRSEKAVLVCILTPDSLISVRLTMTFPPGDKFDITRHAIDNAEIEIFENSTSLGLMNGKGMGAYQLDVLPRPGHLYTIAAKTPLGTLKASDSLILSFPPSFEVSRPNPQNPNSNPDFFVTLSRQKQETGNYWFSMKEIKNGDKSGDVWFNMSSDSPYLDNFNASEDQFYPFKNYGYLARLLPDVYGEAKISITCYNQINTIFRGGGAFAVRASYLSKPYDLFLRSAVHAIDNRFLNTNGLLNNPFYEPTIISSNIEGGLGVFGSVITREFVIEELK